MINVNLVYLDAKVKLEESPKPLIFPFKNLLYGAMLSKSQSTHQNENTDTYIELLCFGSKIIYKFHARTIYEITLLEPAQRLSMLKEH